MPNFKDYITNNPTETNNIFHIYCIHKKTGRETSKLYTIKIHNNESVVLRMETETRKINAKHQQNTNYTIKLQGTQKSDDGIID